MDPIQAQRGVGLLYARDNWCLENISFVNTLGPTGGPFNLATLRGANLEGFVNRACERTITSRGLGAG